MNMETTNKIALVTGGSRGLGKNMALHLADKGIDVILTYRTQKEEADSVVAAIEEKGRKAIAIALDVADVASFQGFIGQVIETLQRYWGRDTFDFLINNAGIGVRSAITDTTEEMFDSLFNVHFKGVYFLTQRALPLLADNGRIVNISTGLARFATPGYSAYASMKGAIETFTKYVAKELGARGITANVVAPGPVDTDFTRPGFEANPQAKEFLASQTTLGRVGVADDIGGVVAFLCSEEARWITAQRIEVSGGIFL
jgi:NAD(P)-dependent dehydrogenase (short-subunit alcohol dehydrogenase family)